MRTVRASVVALFLVVWAGAAAGADYWPLTPGATFEYASGSGSCSVDILVGTIPDWFYGWICRRSHLYSDWVSDYFTTDANGDVLWGGYDITLGGEYPDFEHWMFSPSPVFLDLPLAVGKQWQCETLAMYVYAEHVVVTYPATFQFTVTGAETISTPAGDFETLVLEVLVLFTGLQPATMTRSINHVHHLHRNLGPVDAGSYLLTGWTGVVANESATWGEVKALYGR
jgi:hypothetical protein